MVSAKQKLSLLQFSDVLLDARLSFKGMDMSASKRNDRNNEALQSVLNLCRIARDRHADAVIIPGNLWDDQSVTSATVASLVAAFDDLGEIPVVITPGKMDPYSPRSFYNPSVLTTFGLPRWSKNVHIFTVSNATGFILPMRADVCLVGSAVTRSGSSGTPKPVDTGTATCLLRINPDCNDVAAKEPALLEDYAYTAFGGASNFVELAGTDGSIRGAASGSMIARGLEEQGQRHALWIEIGCAEEGAAYEVSVEKLMADRRKLIEVGVKINGVKQQNLADHVRKQIESVGAGADDIILLRVTGIHAPGNEPELGTADLAQSYYHVVVEDKTRPDYYLDKVEPRTTEGRFIHYLQEYKSRSERRDSFVGTEYDTELGPAVVEDALYYGLDALSQRKVTVPDVD